MKLSEKFTTWCHTAPLILSFYSNDFGVSQSKTRTLPLQHKGGDPSLIRYSSKTSKQNFMKLSGIVHYMFTTWCLTAPPILSFYSHDFGVSQSKTRTLPYKTWGSGEYHFVSIAPSISSFLYFSFIDLCLWLFIYIFIHFIFFWFHYLKTTLLV